MDYSKKDGGTRVLDQGVARTLATGMGQTVASNRECGTHRVQRVCCGIKPGQHVSDPTLHAIEEKKAADYEAACEAGLDPVGTTPPYEKFPLELGNKESHHDANGMFAGRKEDQGEETRVHVTSRDAHMGAQIYHAPLRRAGK